MTPILFSLERIRLTSDPRHPTVVQCASCHDSLVLYQPDEDLPHRLLGTCLECRTWFLIDGDTTVMVKLPDESDLRDA
jgi:hypothetical protein